ncbi:precorrin-3B C(17)-methyltransferase [Desulfofustis glycolicus]|uniref:Precorrin-3B C17-methyltransferase n=1 Tax=Desulfofustis glycolicus DSM 9705 TaxID=1121409 RepID=A0A1M5WWB2_9BACT|nr:precorrin-3B C(17)-methyltransferase [Desulfofustis glycolicus]MCB2214499.1 precorrin-3B C(17)-methyltransferase [Desulfobulbaceae bacterium]SHH91936.1 precorrin-3B C17-methyltransferase [Desulfofustis glycolicus DSM 9705]
MENNNGSSGSAGRLSVVGTGPGSLAYLTPAARDTLRDADVVIGYRTYLDLLGEVIADKDIVSSTMMQEVDRVRSALVLAEGGKKVALVSGGDPGVYAMAGLVYEMAAELDSRVDIRVIAGIAALNGCAERLGAPLMHDFASISLSDLLTPWEMIEQRLQAAAGADFVIVLYNPRSKKRSHQLTRALDIIGEHRSPDTPVGIVTAATRQRERVVVTSLEAFDVELVDMQTTVIVGNSHTFVWRGKMITPRGYRSKYRLD